MNEEFFITLSNSFWLIHNSIFLILLSLSIYNIIYRRQLTKESLITLCIIPIISITFFLKAVFRDNGITEFEFLFDSIINLEPFAIFISIAYIYLGFYIVKLIFNLKFEILSSN